jgi:hypothetical protein
MYQVNIPSMETVRKLDADQIKNTLINHFMLAHWEFKICKKISYGTVLDM